jgi:hypothetical protein
VALRSILGVAQTMLRDKELSRRVFSLLRFRAPFKRKKDDHSRGHRDEMLNHLLLPEVGNSGLYRLYDD